MVKTLQPALLSLVFICGLPGFSWAQGWYNQDRKATDSYHRQGPNQGGFHRHFVNPDLTLVSGMDDIDGRVLTAGDPDPVTADDQASAGNTASVSVPPESDDGAYYIVNVPNNTGTYTPVRIEKSGSGYIGPNGEFYYPFPEISQLKAMYGI